MDKETLMLLQVANSILLGLVSVPENINAIETVMIEKAVRMASGLIDEVENFEVDN